MVTHDEGQDTIDLWAAADGVSGSELRLIAAVAAQYRVSHRRARVILTTLRTIEARKRRRAAGRRVW